ncbi:MAG: redoxin domain-containing protein [Balneola sp.]|nr:redoxin domain-containing protein [Balneola sp.]MBO6650421.1 redoxin domain-containing protein [Balneola sp.]MBO6710183.1 redoxin domain-containing protein [Balneola sp.]MBO6798867.1 redoxin domain-containing protein [Balneola sp.]MBO6869981.1 redoxin domain-containing protein [Balneola sp.]
MSQQMEQLAIGSDAPLADRSMQTVSGEDITLDSAVKANGLVVIFSCNTCPWVDRWEDRYPVVSEIASKNEVGMIALNSNESYRERGDGMKDMIQRAKKMKYDFPYALDKDHKIADAFGATRTPHVYLFDADMKLVYVGAIDDNARDANAVESFYLKDAIEQMVKGEEITQPQTRSLGCTIKRVSE